MRGGRREGRYAKPFRKLAGLLHKYHYAKINQQCREHV